MRRMSTEYRRPYSHAEIDRAGGPEESPSPEHEGVELDIAMEAYREDVTNPVWAGCVVRKMGRDFKRYKLYGGDEDGKKKSIY